MSPIALFCAMFPAGPSLVALVKRSYAIHGNTLRPMTDSPKTHIDAEYVASTNPGAGERLTADVDLFAAHKPWTDVVLTGSAFSSRGPVRMLDTGLKVGPLRKTVRVWGNRSLHLDAFDRPRFSEPEPFVSMPLTWDHAYGGRDLVAEERTRPARRVFSRAEHRAHGAVAYPRNPAGRGFFIDIERERLVGALAPNLEDAEDPVTPDRVLAKTPLDWLDRPAAACYEPVDWFTFPRVAFWAGAAHEPATRPIYEARRGLLAARDLAGRDFPGNPDPRAYNCAPTGLHGARLQGNERVALWNLLPGREHLELDLPAERPAILLEPAGCGIRELPTDLQTVSIEPMRARVTLTWTATLRVAARFSEETCGEMRRAVRWQS